VTHLHKSGEKAFTTKLEDANGLSGLWYLNKLSRSFVLVTQHRQRVAGLDLERYGFAVAGIAEQLYRYQLKAQPYRGSPWKKSRGRKRERLRRGFLQDGGSVAESASSPAMLGSFLSPCPSNIATYGQFLPGNGSTSATRDRIA
jgi:hypothetical protein